MCFAPQRRALFRHFFDIRTSKSGPRPSVFNTFDFKMCLAPQQRALFRHLNFQKCSENGVFCTFCLPNVLCATTACTFSTSQLPKVVRSSSVLSILTWKCASRHNGVHFFMSHLASWLRTRRFSEPTFRPSGASNHWKNTVFRDFPTFSRICIFFLPDSFSSDLLSSNLPLPSASALLCFSSVHIVGSLTSKLPSINSMPSVNWTWLTWLAGKFPISSMNFPCSWLAADRTPPAFVRFSVSPTFLTRSCSVDGVGWGGWGGINVMCTVRRTRSAFQATSNTLLTLCSALLHVTSRCYALHFFK